MRYLTYSELIFINARLLNDPEMLTGRKKVRDIDLLLAAEQRPQSSAFGQDAYPTLETKAAALLHSIARNHPFRDGNKRTATVAALLMMSVNGCCVNWDQAEALAMILDVAEGRRPLDDFAAWLQYTSCDSSPEADADHDAAMIERIILEQKWLLDELEKR